MAEEITLHVDLPEVVEMPVRTEIKCGGTSVYVHEHGMQGSGDWAVWTSIGGGSVIAGGTIGYSLRTALGDARAYVCREERRRLMFVQLREALETEASNAG